MANSITKEEQLTREGVDELEPLRFRWLVLTLSFWGIAIALVLVIFAIYNANKSNPIPQNVLLISAIVSLAIIVTLGVISSKKGKQFRLQFDNWRNRAINYLDSTAQFQPDDYIGQSHFDLSGLNSKQYNTYSGRNLLVVGNMQSSYLSVQHRYKQTYYTTDSNGRSVQQQREVVVPIFDGMLLVLPAALPQLGCVILQPKQNFIKKLLQSNKTDVVPSDLHKITVASPELNNHYVIGTSDKFIGHRVLTPTLMVSLWDYRNQFKNLPRYSYKGDLLYVLLKDVSMECGKRPTRWTTVTIGRLQQVIRDCHESIESLKDTAKKLKPT